MLAAPAASTQPLTLRQASSLSDQALARRVLGEAGRLYAEVERPDPAELPPMGATGLYFLNFATAPRWSGYAGICEADVALVHFRPVPGSPLSGRDPPSRIESLSTQRRFRISGDAATGSRWIEGNREAQGRACASAGPVLPLDHNRPRFFTVRSASGDANDASFAARVLQEALRKSERGELVATCSRQPCQGGRATVGTFDVGRLASVQIDRCAPAAPELCVHAAMWLPDSDRFGQHELVLRIETGNASTETIAPPTIRGIGAASMLGET